MSRLNPARLTLSRPLLLSLSALALSGCASSPKPVAINLPAMYREPCARAPLGPLETVGDLGALVVRQEAAVASCDALRAGVVAIVDGYTNVTKPKRWRLPWIR